ncbi:hypothetical protein AB0M87_04745 [Streptomyces sp. NPDC051320]|uniref:hypothetical protein n=1 Tax=Streptomyces sp. NPDC051320 TaxID=3154644 RepID=UPI00341ACC56
MRTVTHSSQAALALRHELFSRLSHAAGRELTEVRVTAHKRNDARFWCVMALDCNRLETPLPQGAARTITYQLRRAFPDARWGRAQDYDVITGVLSEHVVTVPACLVDAL